VNSDIEAEFTLDRRRTQARSLRERRDVGTPRHDFYQVKLMHEFLSKKVRRPDGHLEPLPAQKPTDVDFHKSRGPHGPVPQMLRALVSS